jgi:hypothetical protein
MTRGDNHRWWSIAIALVFSLFYVQLFPILIGGFVIYAYPYWPTPLAAVYVLGGILMQVWFSVGRTRPADRPQSLWPQVVTGIIYSAAALVLSGGIYQS